MPARRSSSRPVPGLVLLAAALTALALPVLAAVPSFGPGNEAAFARIFGAGDTPPAGCRWLGASILDVKAVSRYACGGPELTVSVFPAGTEGPAAAATAHFRFEAEPAEAFPLELLEWIVGRAEAGAAAADPGVLARLAPLHLLAGLALLLALYSGAVLAWRGRRGRSGAAARDSVGPHALLAFGAAAAAAVWAASRFRFVFDDFMLLGRLRSAPWHVDPSARLVTVNLHGALGLASGAPELWFAAANVVALGAGAWLLGVLARRAGLSRSAALLSAALYLAAPGMLEQLRWLAGFQHLLANALLFASVLVADSLLRPSDASAPATRVRWTLLVALAFLGAMSKYAVFLLVVPLGAAWGLFVARVPLRSVRLWSVVLVQASAIVLPVVLVGLRDGDEVHNGALSAAAGNLLPLAALLAGALALPAAILLVALATRLGERRPLEGGGRMARHGALLLALAGVALAPFLLNRAYLNPYYPALAFAILGVGLAGATDLLISRSPLRRWLAAPLIAALILPWGGVRSVSAASPENAIAPWLASVSQAARTVRHAPRHVHLVPDCDPGPERDAAREALIRWHHVACGSFGLQWASGSDAVELTVEGLPPDARRASSRPDVVLGYCPGASPELRAPQRVAAP